VPKKKSENYFFDFFQDTRELKKRKLKPLMGSSNNSTIKIKAQPSKYPHNKRKNS
jgi:hypothetical protein